MGQLVCSCPGKRSDGNFWLHLDPPMLHDCNEVPEVWLGTHETILARGEEEVPQGDGEVYCRVQGGEAGAGLVEEDYGAAGEGPEWFGEEGTDKFLQVSCRHQDNKIVWSIILHDARARTGFFSITN